MNQDIKYSSINAFLLWFIIYKVQVGVGLAGFASKIYEDAGNDAWVSVLLAGLLSHAAAAIMLAVLSREPGKDLYDIQRSLYGKLIGACLNLLYCLYLGAVGFAVMRSYIEIVQMWLFPDMPTWTLSVLLLALSLYGIFGGLRVVVGICFLASILVVLLIGMLYFPLRYAQWGELLPIFNHDWMSLFKGAYHMTFSMLGIEILMFVYPFVKDKKKASLYTHIGVATTWMIYLIYMLMPIVYFSGEQLKKTIMPTLTLIKIVEFPFIERMEYIVVSLYLIGIIPNITLYLWAASRGIKKATGITQRLALLALAAGYCLGSILLNGRIAIDSFVNMVGLAGFILALVYPFVLWMAVRLARRWRSS
jgi:spore germination protein (amino acid permease)